MQVTHDQNQKQILPDPKLSNLEPNWITRLKYIGYHLMVPQNILHIKKY